MPIEVITSLALPVPVGPYSHAVLAYGMAYLSGQIAPAPTAAVGGEYSIATETEQVLAQLEAVPLLMPLWGRYAVFRPT